MTPNEFKQWREQEFDDALQKRCDEEGLTLRIVPRNSDTTIYIINGEGYVLHNTGNKIWWNKIKYGGIKLGLGDIIDYEV